MSHVQHSLGFIQAKADYKGYIPGYLSFKKGEIFVVLSTDKITGNFFVSSLTKNEWADKIPFSGTDQGYVPISLFNLVDSYNYQKKYQFEYLNHNKKLLELSNYQRSKAHNILDDFIKSSKKLIKGPKKVIKPKKTVKQKKLNVITT